MTSQILHQCPCLFFLALLVALSSIENCAKVLQEGSLTSMCCAHDNTETDDTYPDMNPIHREGLGWRSQFCTDSQGAEGPPGNAKAASQGNH